MAQLLGSLLVRLGLETGAFKSGLDASEKQLRATAKRIAAVGQSMQNIGKGLSMAVTLPIAGLAAASVKAALESQDALGQVDAALKSMGGAAGRTREQLQALATSEMRKSLYDDDEILRKVTANMLTFGNVTGAVFDRAQIAVVDMATRLKIDLQAATILVGKALNDPVNGMAALGKSGALSKEWIIANKALIASLVATGQIATAQGIILGAVEKQFAGSGEAALLAAGPAAAAAKAVDEAMEAMGAAILPLLPPITQAITAIAAAFSGLSPATQKNVVIMLGLAAALGPVLVAVGTLVTFAAPVAALFSAFMASAAVTTALGALGPAILAVGRAMLVLALSPVGLTIMGIAAAVAVVYQAWKNWDLIAPILARLYSNVKKYLVDLLAPVWRVVTGSIDAVVGAFRRMYDAVVGRSYVPDMVDGIAAQMARLDAVMVSPARKGVEKVKAAFEKLSEDTRSLMDELFPEARGLADQLNKVKVLQDAIKAGGAAGFTTAQLRAGQQKLSAGQRMPGPADPGHLTTMDAANAAMREMANDNAEAIQAANVRIVQSYKDMAQGTISALQNMTAAIKGGGFLDILAASIDLALQLGSVGAFGKKTQARINAPGRAAGGSVMGGRAYMVGERGPELMVPGRSGAVIPNHALGGGGGIRIHVEASPYFDVRVQQGISQAAPAIAAAGGEVGIQRMAYRNSRRVA